jgi:hypothetical protein
MFEQYPDKKKGDRLEASHVNALNEAARLVTGRGPGSFGYGQDGKNANLPPFRQQRVIVVAEDFGIGQADGVQDQYEIRMRYYDIDDDTWKTDDEGSTQFLDATDTGDTFEEDDKLNAYWDPQRDMWVPFNSSGIEPLPGGGCDCCPGCVCYPEDEDDVTSGCGDIGCLLKTYKVVMQNLPFVNGQTTLNYQSGCTFVSDTFEVIICGNTYGDHHWKLIVGASIGDSILTLENDGGDDVPLEYISQRPFRMLCGTEFVFKENCDLYATTELKTIAHTWPTKACVNPIGSTDCEECVSTVPAVCCDDGFPSTFKATLQFNPIDCSNLDGLEIFINYVGGTDYWEGTASAPCGTITLRMHILGTLTSTSCQATFELFKNGEDCNPGGLNFGNKVVTCPFTPLTSSSMSWSNTGNCNCCNLGTGNSFTVDVEAAV